MDDERKDTAVLFEKTLSATVWFLGRIATFPKDQRYIVGRRMSDVILEFDEKLVRAWRAGRKERLLDDLAALLDQIRFYLRLSVEMKFMSPAQFKHGSELCRDVGRLIGGWTREDKRARMTGGEGN
jgi:hypothetical protein